MMNGACKNLQESYIFDASILERGGISMPKINPLTFDDLNSAIAYDSEAGTFTWRINAARNVKAGMSAGCAKGTRFSKKHNRDVRYIYIRLNDFEVPAARVAWLLHYGAWPAGNIQFDDGNTENLKIKNLKEGKTYHVTTDADGIKSRKMTKEAQRHYGLKRYYGMTGEEYGEMLAAQKGLCAVCGKPETAMFNGVPKVMHVDHDHATGQIRELLCGSCNGMLGLAKDSPETLRSAADYIEKHQARLNNVVALSGRLKAETE